ncbi:hypothetical protein HNQ02_002849 [Flavobacterium sp. 7E]|uniref:hypothetical protein n=1 Tax=unclassified Flavobacterium TaxID=196869 RepID=UPI00156FF67A|nr:MULTISPECIES: hypothetical protein [unclassified Flavobacterium]MBE0393791.1 hypothetical protein [Flavobacterium sp. PL002]NRS89915.1 hypothetical protein [Flavobacterium sp. 7E]
MNALKIVVLIILFSITNNINAQKVNPVDTLNCSISQSELLLSGKPFASAAPLLFRVFNEDYEYAVFQLGKRKRKLFLYFKIFSENVCVKQKQPLELYFKNGDKYVLKNSFAVNCDGTAALQLRRRDIKKLMNNDINTIRFYTFNKDYEFNPNEIDNQNIKVYLQCLKLYKIKKKK